MVQSTALQSWLIVCVLLVSRVFLVFSESRAAISQQLLRCPVNMALSLIHYCSLMGLAVRVALCICIGTIGPSPAFSQHGAHGIAARLWATDKE